MLNFLNQIQVGSNYLATSIGGILALLGVILFLKLTRNRIIFFNHGQKTKKVKFNLTEQVKIDYKREEKPEENQLKPVQDEKESAKLECPFAKEFTECPFSQNNEKIKKMELSPEESQAEQEYRKSQLDVIFKLLKEQETARLNSKNDSHLYEKIPKFSCSKENDEYKFSVLNHETLEYTPFEEKELESELENIFSSQIKLYGL